MEVKQPQEAIDTLMNQCAEQLDKGGSKYPGMSYEEGIRTGIEWLEGQGWDPGQSPLD